MYVAKCHIDKEYPVTGDRGFPTPMARNSRCIFTVVRGHNTVEFTNWQCNTSGCSNQTVNCALTNCWNRHMRLHVIICVLPETSMLCVVMAHMCVSELSLVIIYNTETWSVDSSILNTESCRVIKTTFSAASDDKIGIITTLGLNK